MSSFVNRSRRVFLPMAIAVLVTACFRSDGDDTIDFSGCPQFRYNTRICDFGELLYPMDLVRLNDSTLAVYEPKGDDCYVQIYNTDTRNRINSLCHKGDGPDDYMNIRFMPGLQICRSGFAVGDSRRLDFYDTDSVSCRDYNGSCILEVPDPMSRYNYLLAISEDVIVFNQTGEHSITVYHPSTGKITYVDNLPDYMPDGISPFILNMEVYDAVYSCHGNTIIRAYKNWNRIDLVDFNTGEVKVLCLPDCRYNKDHYQVDTENKTATKGREAKTFFTKVKTTDKYIYALSWNSTPVEIKNGNVTSTIYQLDHSGNPVASYVFDIPVSNFDVDRSTDEITFLIGIAEDDEIHVLEPFYDR